MAFGGFNNSRGNQPVAEINMVPLIDVMLVLLVIFIVTAPLLTHAVKLDLPKVSSQANQTKPEHIQLAITSQEQLYWNGEVVDKDQVKQRFQEAGRRATVPELHLQADRQTRYQLLAEIMADASRAGLNKIGFVSDPTTAAP